MQIKKFLYLILCCLFSLVIFTGCTNNENNWKNIDAEKVIIYYNDKTVTLEEKETIKEFIELLQVDTWEISDSNANDEVEKNLTVDLYKNDEQVGEMIFFSNNIVQFKIEIASFELEASGNISENVIETYIVE